MTVCFLGWNLPFCMDAEKSSQLYFFYLWSKHLQPRFGMSIYFPILVLNISFGSAFVHWTRNFWLVIMYFCLCIWLLCLCLMLLFITILLCLQSLRCFVLSEWWKHLYEYHAAGISLSFCLSLSVCACMSVCKPFYYDELWCWCSLTLRWAYQHSSVFLFLLEGLCPLSTLVFLLYKLKNRIPG